MIIFQYMHASLHFHGPPLSLALALDVLLCDSAVCHKFIYNNEMMLKRDFKIYGKCRCIRTHTHAPLYVAQSA